MSAESHKTRQRLQDRRAHLSGAEFKIASYLQEQLEKADGQSILLDDERLAAATGVSLRQAGVVRKSLVNQGLVQAETVRGRGTIYRFPGSDTAPPAAVIPSKPVETPVSAAVPEPHSATSAGTMNDAEVLVAEMLEGQVRSYLPNYQIPPLRLRR